jgi:hypothetical protein
VDTVPSVEPPSSPEELPLLDPLLPDEPELDVELVPDEDVEPLAEDPEEEVELPLDPELPPDVDPPPELDVEPLPDEEEDWKGFPDPLSEEPHAAPTATPALNTMAVESRALFFMLPLLALTASATNMPAADDPPPDGRIGSGRPCPHSVPSVWIRSLTPDAARTERPSRP